MLHPRGCSNDPAHHTLCQSHTTPAGLVIPDNRRQPSQLISLPAKIVCATGLLVIVSCAAILIVTNTNQEEEVEEAQYNVLVLGGVNDGGVTTSVEEVHLGLCPSKESPPIPDLPQPLEDIIGGYLDSGAVLVCGKEEGSTSCFIFRSSSHKWEMASGPRELKPHSAMGIVDDKAFVIGSSNSSYDFGKGTCEAYSDQAGTWQPCPGLPDVDQHCITSYDGVMYSTGGYQHGRAAYSLEPGWHQDRWRNSSAALHPRYSHGCAVLPLSSGPQLLLAGGLNPATGSCAQTELVSLGQGPHRVALEQIGCRSGASLVTMGERVFMVGGKRSAGELPEDLLELDVATLSWHTANTRRLEKGRHGHVALRIPCNFHATKKPQFHKLLEMP